MHKKMLAATFVTFSLLGIVNDSKAMDRLTTCLNASLTPRPLNLANNQIPVVLPINALTQTTTTAAQLTDLSSSSEMHSDTFEGSNIGNSPEIISSPEESLTEPPAKRPKTAHPMADFIEKLSLSQRKKSIVTAHINSCFAEFGEDLVSEYYEGLYNKTAPFPKWKNKIREYFVLLGKSIPFEAIEDASQKTITEIVKQLDEEQTKFFYCEEPLSPEDMTLISECIGCNLPIGELCIRDCDINSEYAEKIGDALTINTTLTTLDLRGNDISLNAWGKEATEGTTAISQALMINSTLTKLNISRNVLSQEEASMIFESLKDNTSLAYLNIYGNTIGDEGTISLADSLIKNTSLTWLNLYQNEISDGGAIKLSELLLKNSVLIWLNLGANYISDKGEEHISDSLRFNTTLTTLHLRPQYQKQQADTLLWILNSPEKND